MILVQQVSHIDLSNANPARVHEEVRTNVNRSHRGDNPVLRPTGIQIAIKPLPGPINREHQKPINSKTSFLALGGLNEDKLCDILQAMAPTNVKTVLHQTSLLHIESNLYRLEGLLSPTQGQPSQQQSGQITLQSVLINKPKFLKATHRSTEI